jgi:mono/diheme cytochrome c family protein
MMSERRRTMRRSIVIMAFFASALMAAAIGQQAPTPPAPANSTQGTTGPVLANPHYPFTPADKVRKNPEKFTADSAEAGRKLFASQCAMCHGVTGNGKGDLATTLKLPLPDFTKPTVLKGYTDGELFKILNVGNGMMPGQGQRLSEKHLWDIVNFLREVGGGVPPSAGSVSAGNKGHR